VASNATAEGRALNRRVEIIVQSAVVQQTLDNAGLDKTPATTPTPEASNSGREGAHGREREREADGADISPHLGVG